MGTTPCSQHGCRQKRMTHHNHRHRMPDHALHEANYGT